MKVWVLGRLSTTQHVLLTVPQHVLLTVRLRWKIKDVGSIWMRFRKWLSVETREDLWMGVRGLKAVLTHEWAGTNTTPQGK